MTITPGHWLALSAALFTIGLIGVLVRRTINKAVQRARG